MSWGICLSYILFLPTTTHIISDGLKHMGRPVRKKENAKVTTV